MRLNLNPVEGHPDWHLGCVVVTVDGSLYGHRTVTVYGPNGEQFDVESHDGTSALHALAAERITQ